MVTIKSINTIDHEIYEMRVYYTYDGKFNDIISRFENYTTKLFEKHGFNNVGYWTTSRKIHYHLLINSNNGKEALVYTVSRIWKQGMNHGITLLMILNGLKFSREQERWSIVKKLNKYFISYYFQI